MVGRKENRSYLTGFLHIKENARKKHNAKDMRDKRIIWGNYPGQEKDRVGRRL